MKKIALSVVFLTTIALTTEVDQNVSNQVERIEKSYQKITVLHKKVKDRIAKIEFYILNNTCIQKQYQIQYFQKNIEKIESDIQRLNDVNMTEEIKELSPSDMRVALKRLEDDYHLNCNSNDGQIKKIISEESK